MRKLRIISIACVGLLIGSCTAQYHLKRAIAKDPSIANTTIVQKDTIVVTKSVKTSDTLVIYNRDTIVQTKDRIVTRFQRVSDTIFYSVECPTDTIKITQQIAQTKIDPVKDRRDLISWIFLGVWILIVSVVVIKKIMDKIL